MPYDLSWLTGQRPLKSRGLNSVYFKYTFGPNTMKLFHWVVTSSGVVLGLLGRRSTSEQGYLFLVMLFSLDYLQKSRKLPP
jgi:hypothetical protein